jgi:hypothetical protein
MSLPSLFTSNPVDFSCSISPNDVVPMAAADEWLASSALQKAVRRGDLSTALSAALRYSQLRGGDIWRRLAVIAFEDIGGADLIALKAAAFASSAKCRVDLGGDLPAMFGAIARMVEAPKDRSPDHLICAAHSHPSFEEIRERVGSLSLGRRIAVAASVDLPIMDRAVAAWYSSGVEWGAERRVGRGDLPGLLTALADTGIPDSVLAPTAIAARRTREPITIMAPLLWQQIGRDAQNALVAEPLLSEACVHGIPLYALDKHTRLGRHAIKAFATQTPEIAAAISDLVPDFLAHRVAGLAAFYADAAQVSPRLVWNGANAIERLGLEADFNTVGVVANQINELISVFVAHLDELNAIRAENIRHLAEQSNG